MKNKWLEILGFIFGIAFILFIVLFAPQIKAINNTLDYRVQKADDVTNYNTIKNVENTCRSMIASYNADKLKYEQYKDSDDKQERSWGEQAKMRANQTASNYNEHILKNSFIWKDSIPADIYMELQYIE